MGTKVRLEKYINFSLISNCIIFNTLAGCNGKDKKSGKGCCGSGRDKEKTITDQSQQSAEELAKKQKEEEERKQKDKEEADRLAKDNAALNKKKQELITKLKGLKSRIEPINDSGYDDLKITDVVTEDQIKLADSKKFVELKNKVDALEQKIVANEETLAKYEELKKKKEGVFIPKFKDLEGKMNIINNLNGCTIRVDSNIITKKMIDDSKYGDMDNIAQKLTDFENEIKTKLTAVKNDLKTKNKEIETQKNNNGFLLRAVLVNEYTDKQIDDCNFSSLNKINDSIIIYYNITKLEPNKVKDYFIGEFKKMENVFNFFLNKGIGKKKLEDNKDNIDSLRTINDFTKNTNVITSAIKSIKYIKSTLDYESSKLNEENEKKLEEIIKLNNKLTIELKYERETKDSYGQTTQEVIYYHPIKKIFLVSNTEINKEIIKVDYNKTSAELNSIENKINNLETKVNDKQKEFIDEITKTFDFLKKAYGKLCDLRAYELKTTDVDSYKSSTSTLFDKIIGEFNTAIIKANSINESNLLTPQLEEFFKNYNLYDDEKDNISNINPNYLVITNYFNSNNQGSNEIAKNIENLMKSLKDCDPDNLKKKILKKIKNLVNTYKKDITVDYILHNIVISKIQKDNKGDFYFYKDESSKEYETEEFDITTYKFSIATDKIILPKEINGDDILEFDYMKEIIENFILLFNHNVEIFKKIKEYFSKCKIKDFLGNVGYEKLINKQLLNGGHYIKEEDLLKVNILEDLKNINIDEYFENYLDINKFISNYLNPDHKTLVNFESLVSKLPDFFSKYYHKREDNLKFYKDNNLAKYIDIRMEYVIFNPDILRVFFYQCFTYGSATSSKYCEDKFNYVEDFYKNIINLYKNYITTSDADTYFYNFFKVFSTEPLEAITRSSSGIKPDEKFMKDGVIIFANGYNFFLKTELYFIKYGVLCKELPDYFYFNKNNKTINVEEYKLEKYR